jgi:hypothetical protein
VVNFVHANFRAEDRVQHGTFADVLISEGKERGTSNVNLSHWKPPE